MLKIWAVSIKKTETVTGDTRSPKVFHLINQVPRQLSSSSVQHPFHNGRLTVCIRKTGYDFWGVSWWPDGSWKILGTHHGYMDRTHDLEKNTHRTVQNWRKLLFIHSMDVMLHCLNRSRRLWFIKTSIIHGSIAPCEPPLIFFRNLNPMTRPALFENKLQSWEIFYGKFENTLIGN